MRATLIAGSAFHLVSLAAAQCMTTTTTHVGINTVIGNPEAFKSSLDAKYSKSGAPITNTVFVHTSVYTYPGGSFTGYGIYESGALASEGYDFVTRTVTETSCETTEPPKTEPHDHDDHDHSDELPVSPTGSICTPHGDHWHCHPSTTAPNASGVTSSQPTATCEPHGDHWHCPSGMPEPTNKPGDDDHEHGDEHDDEHNHPQDQTTCEPHGDHWHCPSGVPEPTFMPSMSQTTLQTAAVTSPTTAQNSSLPQTVVNSRAGRVVVPVTGGVGAVFAVWAFL